MLVKLTGDNRDLIIRVLQDETGESAVYHGLPDFTYSVGRCTLLRSGDIRIDEDVYANKKEILREVNALRRLAELGLCDYPYETTTEFYDADIVYPIEGHSAGSLMNLISMKGTDSTYAKI